MNRSAKGFRLESGKIAGDDLQRGGVPKRQGYQSGSGEKKRGKPQELHLGRGGASVWWQLATEDLDINKNGKGGGKGVHQTKGLDIEKDSPGGEIPKGGKDQGPQGVNHGVGYRAGQIWLMEWIDGMKGGSAGKIRGGKASQKAGALEARGSMTNKHK